MSPAQVELFSGQTDVLGEGPLWSANEEALYWLDIGTKRLFRKTLAAGTPLSWELPEYPGCIAELTRGSVAIAMGAGVHRYDLATRAAELIAAAPPMHPEIRFNDGKVDPRGRLWVGTMRNSFATKSSSASTQEAAGEIYRFNGNGNVQTMERHIGMANTIAWSADETRFYFADSARSEIYVCDYDTDQGAIRNRRTFFAAPALGLPDGSAIDTDGCLWNARWDFGAVIRVTPQGDVDCTIELPVARPTNCIFGGPNLEILFVTSARVGLTPEQLEGCPLSGSVFAVSGAGQGIAVPAFRS